MASGLFGFFLKDKVTASATQNFDDFEGISETIQFQKHIVGRKVLNKLNQDRFFKENELFIIGFEGINLTDGIQNFDDFFRNYQKKGIDFVSQLKGGFNGFIFDKKQQKLYLFTDNLATRRFYYYFNQQYGFAFASSMQVLTKVLRQKNIPYTLNHDAVYMMALYGIILEDYTYVSEIKVLPYGHILIFDVSQKKIKKQRYFEYQSGIIPIAYDEAINKIENLLVSSIERIWQKNKQYSDSYFTLLSGGMDARVNVLIAKELGFDNIQSLTFGQSGSKDIVYAKQIAKGEGFNHHTEYLDGGDFLIDNIYENYIIPNDGMIFYNGSAHLTSVLRKFDWQNTPVLHSGQIGDVLFGSFAKNTFDFQQNKEKLGYTGFVQHPELLNKISVLNEILEKYQNRGYELYIYEQRQINGTIMGDRSINHLVDSFSSFYDADLIQFCMLLPNDYKKYQKIYFDWLKKYHPQVVGYPWDKIEMKPDSYWKVKYGKLFKKYYNGLKKYLNLNYESMNPVGLWLKENPVILQTLKRIFETEIHQPYITPELQKDLIRIYHDDIFESRNKFTIITVLLALKLHFAKLD